MTGRVRGDRPYRKSKWSHLYEVRDTIGQFAVFQFVCNRRAAGGGNIETKLRHPGGARRHHRHQPHLPDDHGAGEILRRRQRLLRPSPHRL
nr:hypothetical protein SHINE37_30210 [Rhizobiaceae bacterium]